jgi:uncharacterized protein YceH (UPF0502 family)
MLYDHAVEILLTEVEIRVLGALVEKEITTPDYYPLSLNALVNACNQKSNREPVMELDENVVRDALLSLQEKRLAGPASGADSRVTKYEHRLESFNFSRREVAVLCVLLLRGPQTPGELRGRTERMYRFEDLEQVNSALQQLMQRQPPLAAMLARQPGTKEVRYAHLLGGPVDSWTPPAATPIGTTEIRVGELEEQVRSLQSEVASLKEQFAAFRKQFE